MDVKVCFLQTKAATTIIRGTYIHPYDCSSCITHLCDLDLYVTADSLGCLALFLRQIFSSDDSVETRVHTWLNSIYLLSAPAAIHP